jgi:hypothetical protein
VRNSNFLPIAVSTRNHRRNALAREKCTKGIVRMYIQLSVMSSGVISGTAVFGSPERLIIFRHIRKIAKNDY